MPTESAPDQTVVGDALGEPAVVENAHLFEPYECGVTGVRSDSPCQLLGDLGAGERSSGEHRERERHRCCERQLHVISGRSSLAGSRAHCSSLVDVPRKYVSSLIAARAPI